jgi:predicted glycogen debranching enzyme
MIRFQSDVTADLAKSGRLEWLLSNGLGGYASSTITGLNTRRYHGLLTAALNPPGARTLLLQKVEETVNVGGDEFRLSTNAFPGTLYPTGFRCLEEFRLDPFPVFRFRVGGAVLEKEVCLVHGENTVILQCRVLEAGTPIRLGMDLLVNYRNHDTLTHENASLKFTAESAGRLVKITAGEKTVPFYAYADKGEFASTGYWYRDFVYEQERERGYDFQEDAYSPGRFSVELGKGDSVNLAVSIHSPRPEMLEVIVAEERRRRGAAGESEDEFLRSLLTASQAFIVRRGDGASCIAGYHWFADWGRDAMISLPGLALVTSRFRDAELVLKTFAKNMEYGLIPNYYSESDGSPQYNSLDATLWFFHACRKYYQYTKDAATIKALYPTLKRSADSLLQGTIFEIKADADLLLNIGRSEVQLTWMDAKIGDFCVTPRNGKPVEINALWHCALDTMSGFAGLIGEKKDQEDFNELATRVRESFQEAFWNPATQCLFDRVVSGEGDASMRPNQIIAAALPVKVLGRGEEEAIVRAVQRELLTPYGLRTLSPSDPNYKGRYQGDQQSRDLAYHQGSAWPWLLGPFIKAYVRVSEDHAQARSEALHLLQPIRRHLTEAGLGYISELFDGATPQQPRGCIAQAWSVAEVLRAYYEDVLGKEPKDPLTS